MCQQARQRFTWPPALAAVLALSVINHAFASDGAVKDARVKKWTAVDEKRLANIRGGFVTTTGLILSLGIERSVSIDGTMVSQTNLHIQDVRSLTSADATALKNSLQPIIVQRGQANLLPSSASQLPAATFVQNSLNDQSIRTNTVISTTVNSGSMLKEINFMSSVHDANIGSMLPRN